MSDQTSLRPSPWRLRLLLGFLFCLCVLPVAVTRSTRPWLLLLTLAALLIVGIGLFARSLLQNRFRFTVRTFLLSITIIGVFLATTWNTIQHLTARLAWIVNVEQAGGRVSLSDDPGMRWLKTPIVGKAFASVDRVVFPLASEYVDLIDGVPDSVQHLYMENTQLGDGHLEAVGKCERLVSIALGRNTTDEGLEQLLGLPRLERLKTCSTNISGVGISKLVRLPNLERLAVDANQISAATMQALQSSPKLEGVNVDATKVNDARLEELSQFALIDGIHIGQKVTDAGTIHLRKMPQLSTLTFSGTTITDAAIENMKGLTNLRYLDTTGTLISQEGRRKLDECLPNCKVQ